jgi:hypothetical protein
MAAITDILKQATNGILTEDTLKEIESAFNAAVEDKVKVHVEKALVEQDGDYAEKLKHLLEVVDKDHTKKLLKVVEAIDTNHAIKLKKIVTKFNKELNSGAKLFKEGMISNVSTYLEAYLDEAIPTQKLNEAVKHKKAQIVLEQIKEMLGIDTAIAKDSVRSAIIDGKRQIDEANNRLEVARKELQQYKKQYEFASSQLVLEKKLSTVPSKKRDYLRKVMKGKNVEFINENFDYANNLFDKSESDRLQNLKEEATNTSTSRSVDRPVIEESVSEVNPSRENTGYMNPYLAELSKF